MLKLMRLEIKKFKILHYWKGVVIANLGFIAFLIMLFVIEKNDGEILFENFEMTLSLISSVVRATFLIFASVIIVKIIIDEYKTKSIEIMFTYPISRKKIMAAKMIIVVLFTFLSVFLSTIFIGGLFSVCNIFSTIVPGHIGMDSITNGLLTTLFNSFATAGISLIPMLFGMIRKSAPATIVSAVLIVSFTSTSGNDFNVFSIVAIPITLGIIGLLMGYFSIRNIEKVDVR